MSGAFDDVEVGPWLRTCLTCFAAPCRCEPTSAPRATLRLRVASVSRDAIVFEPHLDLEPGGAGGSGESGRRAPAALPGGRGRRRA